jgi:hypothetical protein
MVDLNEMKYTKKQTTNDCFPVLEFNDSVPYCTLLQSVDSAI